MSPLVRRKWSHFHYKKVYLMFAYNIIFHINMKLVSPHFLLSLQEKKFGRVLFSLIWCLIPGCLFRTVPFWSKPSSYSQHHAPGLTYYIIIGNSCPLESASPLVLREAFQTKQRGNYGLGPKCKRPPPPLNPKWIWNLGAAKQVENEKWKLNLGAF